MTTALGIEKLSVIENASSRDESSVVDWEHQRDIYGELLAAGEFLGTLENHGVFCREDGSADIVRPAGAGVQFLDVCHFKDGVMVREELQRSTEDPTVFVGNISELKPGDRYGFLPWGQDSEGIPKKLTIDPEAWAIDGDVTYIDGKMITPWCVAVSRKPYEWNGLDRPAITREDHEKVIYESHVRAATQNMPGIPDDERGTYKAQGSQVFIDHLTEVRATTVQLMPIEHFVANERFLHDRNRDKSPGDVELENAWGYNTVGFNAPHSAYAASEIPGGQVDEFRDMVANLHAAGFEVIMDVVYNHTAETSDRKDDMLLSALDIDAYHHHDNNAPTDFTGCGPDLDASDPYVQEFILGSLEHWVEDMGVDGFRFDLASTLMRKGKVGNDIDLYTGFAAALTDRMKKLEEKLGKKITLIFEGWDLKHHNPQGFSTLGHAWNDSGKHFLRDFANSGEVSLRDLATFLSGAILPQEKPMHPPINFSNTHDGFTLEDLVSYNFKHNELNRGQSGDDHNRSWNHGYEGVTSNVDILESRQRSKRSIVSLLMLSAGIPQITYGEHESRSQNGNNDPYCQKDLIASDWNELGAEEAAFKQYFIDRTDWRLNGLGAPVWLNGAGEIMLDEQWSSHTLLTMYREGKLEDGQTPQGETTVAVVNTDRSSLPHTMPNVFPYAGDLELVADSNNGISRTEAPIAFRTKTVKIAGKKKTIIVADRETVTSGQAIDMPGRSVKTYRLIATDVRSRYGTYAVKNMLGMHISDMLNFHTEKIAA